MGIAGNVPTQKDRKKEKKDAVKRVKHGNVPHRERKTEKKDRAKRAIKQVWKVGLVVSIHRDHDGQSGFMRSAW
jgi:hypothetical protein